jgi:Zn-dependent metalloprotease
MHALKPCLLAATIALAIAGGSADAAKPPAQPRQAANLARNVVAPEAGIARRDGRYSADGAAIVLYAPDFFAPNRLSKGASAGQFKAAAASSAYDYLVARHAELGLNERDVADLQQVRVRRQPGLTVVRYRQRIGGLPVFGSDIAVTVADNGAILYVGNDSVRQLKQLAAARAALSADRATGIVRAYLGTQAPPSKIERMAFRDAQANTRDVWRVRANHWDVLVDASSGEVLRAQDMRQFARPVASGVGQVFKPDPLSSARATYGDPGYVDGNNADTPQLDSQLKKVVLRTIRFDAASGLYSLSGSYATCRNLEAPNDAACPSLPGKAFNFTRDNINFDAVNAYYNIDTYMRYVNATLGIEAMPYQHARGGVQFDPHAMSGQDNSYYADGDLHFGEGGVDDAQDADVVIHELGHGLHDFLTDGHLSQVQGLSEGVGDYVAAGYSRDQPNQWTPADAPYFWVFNWDGHNPYWPGRVTNWNVGHVYPGDVSRADGHTAGQYWSSCNLVARDAIGGQRMDKAFFTGLAMTGSSSNQKDAAQAVIDAAAAMGYTSAEINAIASAYNVSCTYGVTVPAV